MGKLRNGLYLLIALVAISACKGGETKKEGEKAAHDVKFESYTFDLIGEYYSSDTLDVAGGKYVRFIGQGILPQDMGDGDIHHLRDSLMKLAGVRISDEGKPQPLLPDSMNITDLPGADTDACGYVYSTLAATLVTPRVVVWECYFEDCPCMSAHGNRTTAYVNYCLTDGKILSLADILVPDYKKVLLKKIRSKVKDMGIELLCGLNEIEISDVFEITSTGLQFSYDPYQIAPYSEGTIKVELTAEDLADLLNDHGQYILYGNSPV